ncbi:MAG: IS110 family transposase, partial [Acidimicrobiales bacterium]
HTVVTCRTRYDEETRAYVKRRTAEGKTQREIKRYVARELFRILESSMT